MTTAIQARENEAIDMALISLDQTLSEHGLHHERIPATATEPAEEVGFEVFYDEQTDSVVVESPSERFTFPLLEGEVPVQTIERWIANYAAEALVYIPF